MQFADALSISVVDGSDVPETVLIGINDPNRGDREWSLHEEAIRRDAERAGLTVVKLLGRLTVMAGDGSGQTHCFRVCRGAKAVAAKNQGRGPTEYRCLKAAGQGTMHQGAGACRYHGGNYYGNSPHANSVGRGPNLRYDVARALLGHTAEGDLSVLEQMDLVQELVLQRQMLNAYLNSECFDADGLLLATIPGSVIEKAMQWTESVSKTVERAKRMENATALTRAHIIYLIQTLTRLGKEFVAVDRVQEYGRALLSAFGLEMDSLEHWIEPDEERHALGIGAVIESN